MHDIFAIGNTIGEVGIFSISPLDDEVEDEVVINPSSVVCMQNDSINVETFKKSNPLFKEEHFECGLTNMADAILANENSKCIVRHVSFSDKGDYIVYCCENGRLYIWDIDVDGNFL